MRKQNALVFFLFAVAALPAIAQWGGEKGSKNVIREVRTAEPFEAIEASGIVNVYLKKGNSPAIEVEADDNLIGRITTEFVGKTLRIYTEGNFRSYKAMNVYVTYTELSAIKASGASDVYVESDISASAFRLEVTGAADFEMNTILEAQSFQIVASGSADVEIREIACQAADFDAGGSSDIELEGKATSLTLRLSGSSDFKGERLHVQTCDARLSGSSDAYVHVANELQVTASGSSDFYYGGMPKVQRIKTSGSSDVTPQ